MCWMYTSYGQITVTNSTFPKSGDTLYTATDNLPLGLDILVPGGNKSWDFGSLQAPFISSALVRDAQTGQAYAQFPTSDLVTDFLLGEGYLKVNSGDYAIIGYTGTDPLGLGFAISTALTPPQIIRHAPLNYGDIKSSSYGFVVAFSADSIPDTLLSQFPIMPDSLRLNISGDRTDEVDAWGSMQIPTGIYDVLRQKRVEERNTKFEIMASPLPWIDITALVESFIPGLGLETVTSYYFLNDESIEEIAVVQLDSNDMVSSVTYKSTPDGTTLVKPLLNRRLDISAFPNPAIDDVRIELSNIPPGKYKIKIHNILGVVIDEHPVHIYGNRTVRLDLSSYRKGTYLYAIYDQNDKNLLTKRLVVLRP